MAYVRRYKVLSAFTVLFSFYILAGSFGYGNDSDTYAMIRTGWRLLIGESYQPSRVPGYFAPELLIGVWASKGGYQLSNLVASILGCATMFMFFRMNRNLFDDDIALMNTLIVGLNPFFLIAASSAMDYIYALFFVMLSIELLRARHNLLASIAIGLAISSRLSTVALILPIYGYFGLTAMSWFNTSKQTDKQALARLSASLFVGLLIGIALYVPSFIASKNSFDFLSYAIGDWTPLEHFYRFVYKNISLFGVPAFITITAYIIYTIISRKLFAFNPPLVIAVLAAVLFEEMLFFKVPLDISYLLPILLLFIPAWAYITGERKRIALTLVLVFTVLYNFINISILNIRYDDLGNEALGAQVGVYFKPGVLLEDLSRRQISQEKYFTEFILTANKYKGMQIQLVKWKQVFGINQLMKLHKNN